RWRRCCTSASASITLRCRSITPAAGCSGSRHHGRSEMTKALYTAQAHVVGGRIDGHGRSSDGQLEVDLRLPSELGGKGDGTNPEELFAVGYAACFEGALTTVARRRKEEASDVAIDSRVKLVASEDRGFNIAVELDVSLPSIDDPAKAVEL